MDAVAVGDKYDPILVSPKLRAAIIPQLIERQPLEMRVAQPHQVDVMLAVVEVDDREVVFAKSTGLRVRTTIAVEDDARSIRTPLRLVVTADVVRAVDRLPCIEIEHVDVALRVHGGLKAQLVALRAPRHGHDLVHTR